MLKKGRFIKNQNFEGLVGGDHRKERSSLRNAITGRK
jgi:hypothetical protein